jgi:hypothetical protein
MAAAAANQKTVETVIPDHVPATDFLENGKSKFEGKKQKRADSGCTCTSLTM